MHPIDDEPLTDSDLPDDDVEAGHVSAHVDEGAPIQDDAFFDAFITDTDKLDDVIDATKQGARRFSILFDATGSMSSYWSAVSEGFGQALDQMSKRTGKVILIQLIAYRDHCDGENIMQRSGFHANFDSLKEWISHIRCYGGGDYPEAVDKGLEAVLQSEQESHRCVLVGDAPGHNNSPGYREATLLGQMQCPVFTVRVGHNPYEERLFKNFKKIASLSGGKDFVAQKVEEIADVIATIISHDRELLTAVIGTLPYYPTTETGKLIGEQL